MAVVRLRLPPLSLGLTIPLPQAAVAVAVFLLVYPILQLLRGALTLGVGALLHAIGAWELTRMVVRVLPADPIYTRMAIHSLTGAEPLGLAAHEPVGSTLHALAPTLFLAGGSTDGLFTAAFGLASPLAALALSRFAVEATFLGAGLALALSASSGWPWRAFGLLLYFDVAIRLVRFPPSALELDSAGASFLLYAFFPQATRRDVALSDLLGAYPDTLVRATLGLAVLAAAHLAIAAGFGVWRAVRLMLWLKPAAWPAQETMAPRLFGLAPLAACAAVLLLVQTLTSPAPRQASPSLASEAAWLSVPGLAEPELDPPEASSASPSAQSARGASVVRVVGGNRVYSYTVNGRPEVIRGMGYNPPLSTQPLDRRRATYERNFALMRRANVNLVGGWYEKEFDEVLLDTAYRHGLGVLMPYHLFPHADYESAAYREEMAVEVLNWVLRYRHHPAVHMWGLSNEVLHKLIYPAWLGRPNEEAKQRKAEAFSDFLVELADRVHRVDPDHPIVIREAEEAYVGPIEAALERRPRERPWLIWGVNIFTPRLAQLLTWWRSSGPQHAVLITEFAEGGLPPGQRGRGYERMWAMLRQHPSLVLGGMAYVWSTRGPEEVDRVFGLVDPDGQPPGDALAAIARMYAEDARQQRLRGSEAR